MEAHIQILIQIAGQESLSESLQELLRENREQLLDYVSRYYSEQEATAILKHL